MLFRSHERTNLALPTERADNKTLDDRLRAQHAPVQLVPQSRPPERLVDLLDGPLVSDSAVDVTVPVEVRQHPSDVEDHRVDRNCIHPLTSSST